MGSYLFANQYQNEVIPEDEQSFRQDWFKYFDQVPAGCYKFVFVDPAIGQKDHHDYTAIVVVECDHLGVWYVSVANRYRLTPTQLVDKLFQLHAHLNVQAIGIEQVAYQEALLYMIAEEMRRRKVTLPVKGITRNKTSKQTRILGLVPRFEWGHVYLAHGLTNLEDELLSFPRGSFDDLSDALASLEELVHYPTKPEVKIEKPNSAADPRYEHWYINQLARGIKPEAETEEFL